MKKFDVEITETLQRKVSVEAASQEDAERMVTQAWNNQDYVLDSGDFTGVDFKTVGEHELAETRTMDVLLVQPNAYPKKISVGTELEDLQAMVGGDIEVTIELSCILHVSTDYLLMGSEPSKEEVKNDLLSIISELPTIAKKI